MGIHPAFADRFYLLEGIPSLQAAMADPELDRRVREYMEPPLGPAPDAATHDLTVAHLACSEACLLNRHQIAFGPVADTLTPPLLQQTYGARSVLLVPHQPTSAVL